MAIVEKGQGVNVGETEIPDNQVAIKISSTDAKDYITIDTTDGSELITMGSKTLIKGDLSDAMQGAVSASSGTTSVTGVSTAFLTEVFEGSAIKLGSEIQFYPVIHVLCLKQTIITSESTGEAAQVLTHRTILKLRYTLTAANPCQPILMRVRLK